jgi:hypothetical protein
MPHISIRDSDGAIIGEHGGAKTANETGITRKNFSEVLWGVSLVGVDGRDPTQSRDGAYTAIWTDGTLGSKGNPIAKWDSGTNTVSKMTSGEKTTAVGVSRQNTRDAIAAADKASLLNDDVAAASITAGVITRDNVNEAVDARVAAISDRDLDANPR